MDVTHLLPSNLPSTSVADKGTPLEVDAGFLTVLDPNPIDAESYESNLEEHLTSLARDGIQLLVSQLFPLPVALSSATNTDGPTVKLPPPTTALPRSKPLPKPAPLTKWEQFAKAKGISHVKKDKKVWDDDKQTWVNRWGRDGKNREKEEAWIREVPANAAVDFDPRAKERTERKERVRKNEKKRDGNLARASREITQGTREEKKKDLERTLGTARVSTASMGRFDKKLEGEKNARGVKRKFEPTEAPLESEKKASLALIGKMDSDARKMKTSKYPEDTLNVRKAIRTASRGRGGVALGRESSRGRGGARGGRGRGGRK